MSKIAFLVAVAFALTGSVISAEAQSKVKAKGKDRTTCFNLVDASPGIRTKGFSKLGDIKRQLRREAAIERCMRGERIW